MNNEVILVSPTGHAIGTCDKLQAHIDGTLHRAFSLMIARPRAGGFELLLQKRADHKYHSGAKWSNTCCSHPRPGEELNVAVRRRVKEELGITQSLELIELSSVVYRAELDNGLTENEFDHVFLAIQDEVPITPNPDEVADVKWVNVEKIKRELESTPDRLTAWFPFVFNVVSDYLAEAENLCGKIAS